MRFAHIQDAVYRHPWNITAGGWLSIHEVLQSRLSADYQNGGFDDFVNARPGLEVDPNGIAHIHICGVLGKGLTPIEKSCGNTGYDQIAEETARAEQQGASGILLHVNSPGGHACGNIETATCVSNSDLPVVAWIDELSASAAYAITAGANHIVCAPSAMVGSIGTILPLVDTSAAWEARGMKPAYITHAGGDLKDATWPPSFTEAHRAHLQEMVDDMFGEFKQHVLSNRAVDSAAMRGQCLVGRRALEANLVDTIGTYETAYAEIIKRANQEQT